jgi:hypothetical protein
MKLQYSCSPSKANFTTKDPDTCIEEELLNNEIKKTVVKIINDLKEERQKLVFQVVD